MNCLDLDDVLANACEVLQLEANALLGPKTRSLLAVAGWLALAPDGSAVAHELLICEVMSHGGR